MALVDAGFATMQAASPDPSEFWASDPYVFIFFFLPREDEDVVGAGPVEGVGDLRALGVRAGPDGTDTVREDGSELPPGAATNTATGVPWAMIRDSLRHGWLLTGASWARVWTAQIDGGSNRQRLASAPVGAENKLFVVDVTATVHAFDAGTGQRLWSAGVSEGDANQAARFGGVDAFLDRGDGGVDGVIREDRLGLDVIYIQAKRYAADRAIGPDALRSFSGALDEKGARKGVFITTSRFTSEAERYAAQHQTKRIVLLDGERLAKLMIANGVGMREDRTIVLKRLDLDYFEPDTLA